jgi:transcriptional regulator with XRE-family HTH domain
MARAALGWTLDDLAASAGLSRRAILRYEQGESIMRLRNLWALRHALEEAGVRFVDTGEYAGAVMPPKQAAPNSH